MASTLRDARASWIRDHLIEPPIDAGVVLSEAGVWEYQPTAAEFDDIAQKDLIGRGLARHLYENLETLVESPEPFVIPAIVIRQRVPVITTADPPHRYREKGVHVDVPDHMVDRVASYYAYTAQIINPDRPFTIHTEA